MKDPYGGQGILERKWRAGNKQSEGQTAAEAPESKEVEEGEIAPPEDYVQATTLESLERVGHMGGWQRAGRSDADHYAGPYVLFLVGACS